MICCFPFTYLPDAMLGPLTGVLGPLTMLQPLENSVPSHMQAWVQRGALQLVQASGLDSERIDKAVRAFTAWAAMHGGKPGDLKRLFQSTQGASQWFQGPPTNEIRAQLRSEAQEKEPPPQADALFQAAFFLALAHRYDQQQDDLAVDLGSVHSLETRFGEILGEPDERKTALGPDLTLESIDGPADSGLFMTDRRLESWARIAVSCQIDADLFVTPSRAVWDLLDENFSGLGTARVLKIGLGEKRGEKVGADRGAVAEALAALARDDQPDAAALDHPDLVGHGRDAVLSLTVRVLPGVTPAEMMGRFIEPPVTPETTGPAGRVKNTLVGHASVGRVQV